MFANSIREHHARVEWMMLVALFCLMAIGAAFVFSAAAASDPHSRLYLKQILFYGTGLGAAAVICLVPYHTISRFATVMYWGTILLLVAVFLFGAQRFGAKRWIDLGFFQLQPSEFAKLGFIMMMANYLSRPLEELRLPGNFFKALTLTAIPFVMILKEPDLGSALVFFPIGVVMMFVAGVPLRFLRRFVGGVAILAMLLLVDILFAPPSW